jgi:hypothetical protein
MYAVHHHWVGLASESVIVMVDLWDVLSVAQSVDLIVDRMVVE